MVFVAGLSEDVLPLEVGQRGSGKVPSSAYIWMLIKQSMVVRPRIHLLQ